MYNTIIHPTWLSVVFEDRNQQYGAFQLRKEYERNLIGGLLVSHASLAGLFGLIWLAYAMAPKEVQKQIIDIPYDITTVDLLPKELFEKPKDVPKQPQTVKTTTYLPPVVVPNQEATSELATQEVIENTVISNTTQEGIESNTGNVLDIVESGEIETIQSAEPYISIPEMPSFPSEYGSITNFMGKLIKYPSQAIANGISGKVFVEFVIDENGNVINPKIVKGLGYGCDEEVLRILAMIPKWNPGQMNGRGVKVKMTVPVNFKLSD